MYMIAEVSQYVAVASFAEAWIEIMSDFIVSTFSNVASFAEAWIEIYHSGYFFLASASRLLRGGVD